MITSSQNSRIKQIRQLLEKAKHRREQGLFVVEGVRLAEEALKSGWLPEAAYFAENLSERGMAVVEALAEKEVDTQPVSTNVMASLSDTKTPQGLLLVMKMQEQPLLETVDFVLILDQLRDPGNLGTILRSAAAAGVEGVILTNGSVDPYAPKALRAGMGANFRLPVLQMGWPEISGLIDQHKLQAWLTDVTGGEPHYEADLAQPVALVIGGEAHGISDEARTLDHKQIHIPMPGGAESLNAAMAASILVFEAARQRSI